MRLRNKLLSVILFSIFLQVIISGVFTIYTFLDQSRKSSVEDLFSSWQRARFYMEKLKHYAFIHLLNLSEYIRDN
ncbi:hypothetical protein ES703_37031 [subsurface metagenome]